MDPADHSSDTVPLQGKYDVVPVQPGGPTVIQYTTMNITTEPPRDHIIWSICSLVHANVFCLGLAALIFSVKARDRKMVGDLNGARHYGSTACWFNIFALVLTSIGACVGLAFLAIHVARIISILN